MKTSQRIRIILLGISLALTLFLSGCGADATSLDSSAQAWFEYPFNGDTLPMGPITLVAYAADAEGVSSIRVTVNGKELTTSSIASLAADGSRRLVRTDITWQPTEKGEYVVEAVGVNSSGASGGTGTTRFCIVSCVPGQEPVPDGEEYVKRGSEGPSAPEIDTNSTAATSTSTPQSQSAPIPTNTSTSTPPPPPPGKVAVEFYAHPSTVDAGNCSTLHWNATGATNIYLNEISVWEVGSQDSCPCETETHHLQVVQPDGSYEDYYATISVNGSCYTEIEPTPTVPAPPADTSGPSILSVSTYWEGCSLYGDSYITDESGVSWAEFWFNLNGGGWAWIKMNPSGDTWVSQVGVDTEGMPGTLEYKVRTLDTLNNESWSGVSTRNFAYCGE